MPWGSSNRRFGLEWICIVPTSQSPIGLNPTKSVFAPKYPTYGSKMVHFRLRAGTRTVPEEQNYPHMESFFIFSTDTKAWKVDISINFGIVGRVVRGNSLFRQKKKVSQTSELSKKRGFEDCSSIRAFFQKLMIDEFHINVSQKLTIFDNISSLSWICISDC